MTKIEKKNQYEYKINSKSKKISYFLATPALVRPSPIRRRNSDLAFYAAMSANKIDEDKGRSF